MMDRAEWLQARKKGIGGSDAAAVLGMSRWASPYRVFLDKTSQDDFQEDTPAMEWGRRLEPVILQKYADVTGQQVLKPESELVWHPTIPYLFATVDGYTHERRLVEAKTSKYSDEWGEEYTDQIPVEYQLQVQHYMLVTGFEVVDIAVLIGGNTFSIYTVESDPSLHELMLKGYASFWQRVLTDDPPEPVTEADMLRYFKAKNQSIAADSDIIDKLTEYKALGKEIKKAEAAQCELKKQIMLFMGENDTLIDSDETPIATWKVTRPIERVSVEALKEHYPDVYKKTIVCTPPQRRFLVK